MEVLVLAEKREKKKPKRIKLRRDDFWLIGRINDEGVESFGRRYFIAWRRLIL